MKKRILYFIFLFMFLIISSFILYVPAFSMSLGLRNDKMDPMEKIDESVFINGSSENIPKTSRGDDPFFSANTVYSAVTHYIEAPFVKSEKKAESGESETQNTDDDQFVHEKPISVEQSDSKDAGYFSDALFIGDSRTVGLSIYSGIPSTYYADTGLNILTVLSKSFVKVEKDGQTLNMTVLEALQLNSPYKKVYISFGINEIGWPYSSTFTGSYDYFLNEIKKLLPDACIYIQGIVPVSQEIDDSGYIKNSDIDAYNLLLGELAEKNGVEFIDVSGIYSDAGGVLTSDISSDGIHLNRGGVEKYMEWLLSHTVE